MAECYLYKLPNELLLHLLVPLPTPDLLPLTLISHRLSSMIIRILHNRLLEAAELESHSLLLECYHPSVKLFEPPYFCAYHGTDGLTAYDAPEEMIGSIGERLGEMRNMYSRFRPHQRELEESGRRVVARPGDIPGSRTFPGTVRDNFQGETIRQILSLEAHELFTQLVAQINLVKIGPRSGLFTCFVEVEEGVLRVWKEWLGKTAAEDRKSAKTQVNEVESAGKGKGPAGMSVEVNGNGDDTHILWISPVKNTGIRFRVREKNFCRDVPILIRADEDMPVSFEIEFDELLIRTSHLLLTLEKSLVQEDNSSGKAVVFGSFG